MADEAPAKLLLIHDAYLRQKHLFNRLHPLVDHGKPGKQDIRRVLRKQLHRLLQVGFFQPIVGVQELNPFSPRMGKADISRVGYAAVGDIDHPDALVFGSQPHDQAQARIRRAIIDGNNLDVRKGLFKRRTQRLFYIRLFVVDRNND